MMHYELEVAAILQTFGDHAHLGELLGFGELSTFSINPDRVIPGLLEHVQNALAAMPARLLSGRQAVGKIQLKNITLTVTPAKRSAAWAEPVEINLAIIQQLRSDRSVVGYLPALQLTVMAPTLADFDERLPREITFALQRADALKSLEHLVFIQRAEHVKLEPHSITLKLKTPKERGQEELDDKPNEEDVLAKIANDMTAQVSDKAFELDTVLRQLADALTGADPSSILLVGPSGVGKTAAVREFVRRRAEFGLRETPFWATSGARLAAGALGFGMWQERCQKMIREASRTRAILHLGNLVELMEVGKSNANTVSIAHFLRPAIARGQLLVIAEVTAEQLTLLERHDPHLLAVFRPVKVEEPSEEATKRILQAASRDSPTAPTGEALEATVRLHKRYSSYSAFPGRPLRFLKNLLHEHETRASVNEEAVVAAFAAQTGLPRFLLDDTVPLVLAGARDWFLQRLMGQHAAVDLVVDLLATVKAGLNRPRRPIASLLFIGPTGVGKTEMAKAMAEYFFSNRARLTRFDMSEYSTPSAVARLIGGRFHEEGLLTAKVRQEPFSVLLLDEVEKAHPAFFDLLLQVFGEGRLTDAAGRLADFSNTIIIMTSNLGAASFGKGGFGLAKKQAPDAAGHFIEEVRAFLRPELFNRIDRIIPFLPLDADAVRRITQREMNLLRQRDGLRLRNVDLRLEESSTNHLAETGYDPRYGARPLKRAIERELLSPLAEAMNAYAEGTALQATVATDGAALSVQVKAVGENLLDSGVGPLLPARATTLRRRMQSLQRCAAVRAVENEIYEIQRRLERATERKQKLPDVPLWEARLGRLLPVSTSLASLAQEITTAEEELLIHFYTRGEAGTWSNRIDALQNQFHALLLELYILRHADADRVVIGLYSEHPSRLWQLASAYAEIAQARSFTLHLAWFTHDGRGIIRHRSLDPKAFLADSRQGVFGIALELTGECVFPLLDGENGIHVFEVDKKPLAVQVLCASQSLAEITPPEGVQTPGTILPLNPRRTYDISLSEARDAELDKKVRWTSLAATLGALMDERLRIALEALVTS